MVAFLFALCFLPSSANAAIPPHEVGIAALKQVYYYQRNGHSRSHPKFDAVLHCGVSCALTTKFGAKEALAVGISKEIADALGLGSPSIDDIIADARGVFYGLQLKQDPKPDEACAKKCQAYYIK